MPIHTDQVPDITVSVGVSPHGRLHDHHPLPPLCGAPKLVAQGAGDRDMSRGFHGRKFTKRRGIIVTHLTLGLRGRLFKCKRETFFAFYTIKTLFLQCKTPNRISKLATQLGSSQVARVRGRRLVLAKPSPPPCLLGPLP